MNLFHADTLRVELSPGGIASLWLDVPGKGQNVLGRALLHDLALALEKVASTGEVRVLIIRSAKASGFLAGADLSEFADVRTQADAEAMSARGQDLFGRLAGLRIPSIAVIHGPCLGGGLELALACDVRLIVEQPGTQLGLPEIELGLLPAWGGTQRLPRIVGVERALQVILGGKRLGAGEAFRWRLADGIAPPGDLVDLELGRLMQKALAAGKAARTQLPLLTWRQWLLESNFFGLRLLYRGAERLMQKRVPDDMAGPREALQAVRIGVGQGLDAGLKQEREAAGRLVTSPACRNLINLFLQREKARKLPDEVRNWRRRRSAKSASSAWGRWEPASLSSRPCGVTRSSSARPTRRRSAPASCGSRPCSRKPSSAACSARPTPTGSSRPSRERSPGMGSSRLIS